MFMNRLEKNCNSSAVSFKIQSTNGFLSPFVPLRAIKPGGFDIIKNNVDT